MGESPVKPTPVEETRMLERLYRSSLALLTDFYQLTMAYGYWKTGSVDKEAVFHLTFRRNPFEGGFAIACGLARAVEMIRRFRFDREDIAYLDGLEGHDGKRLFEPAFLDALARMELVVDVDAAPEGTVLFPHEPLVRVRGPILQCQLLETALLNVLNFETLVATKAARVCIAAKGEPVLEFGLRRAQGVDGGVSASRAAYVGGCAATSNVLAGRLLGIPVRGTHAHSWVMSFDSELEAFEAYAGAMPNNCVFLVDTYDTLEGVRNAARVGRTLRARGHEMLGVRLDSGDLAYLSREARRILDEEGFPDAAIVASNDLDEHIVASLKDQGAAIGVWGVGTRLVTGGNQSALGGVYKLGAIRRPGEPWSHRLKLSEQAVKVSNPGILQVRRYGDDRQFLADVIYDEETGIGDGSRMIDPLDQTRRKRLPVGPQAEDLLVPVFRSGRVVHEPASLEEAKARASAQVGRLHAGVKRFVFPHRYPVGLEGRLFDLKTRLMLELRGLAG
jgi:nicotinate phosphoribosyltransferase